MKVWIARHALTEGIIEIDAEDCGDGVVRTVEQYPTYYHKEGRDWHATKESAIAEAEKMRREKIAILKKQIERLEKLNFEEVQNEV